MTRDRLSPERLRTLLSYDPETGFLAWLPRPEDMFPGTGNGGQRGEAARWNGQYAGKTALTAFDTHGYHSGRVLGVQYLAHRIAYAIQTGAWPAAQIDHRNRNRSDNRWSNLGCATNEQNSRNRSRNRNNKSGRAGVIWHLVNSKWVAFIGSGATRAFLGSFTTFAGACEARERAEAARQYVNDGQLAA